jgi:hypothetical protein
MSESIRCRQCNSELNTGGMCPNGHPQVSELASANGSACRNGHVFMYAGTLPDGQIPEGYPCACGQTVKGEPR